LIKKEKLTKAEEIGVKNAARAFLKWFKEELPKVLDQDWHNETQSQEQVKDVITLGLQIRNFCV
jgi:type I restriction enzyme R subunit